ncbi:MAG: sterol desaturase family protein [Planctomycetota bacterium]|jgi:sterol desaturase/sphingolipid hydroxylase (fatty acid hydroxylase superfamily)
MIPLAVITIAVLMILMEVWKGDRPWPKVRGWWRRAFLLNGFQFAVAYAAPVMWDSWMPELRPWSADSLGTTAAALLGYLAITFLFYWWHRWRHEIPFLWRWFHQVHHSPQRIEVITSFYKHPFEILVNSLLSSAIVYFVVGASPIAAAYAVLLTGLAELFYHWNISTPHWIGAWIQRPESHCVHHQEGLHHYNYADLPLWDMLFGTYRNPRKWESTCGFGGEKEQELGRMMKGEVLS